MYHMQKNKTAVQSQCMIAEALYRLMQTKAFHRITITEICEEAGVGRKTFYRNFDWKEDVVDFQLSQLCAEYENEILPNPLDQRLRSHFVFVQKHLDCFITFYRQGLNERLHERFAVFMSDTMPIWTEDAVEQEYQSQYIVAGIEAIQRKWVERGFQESLNEVVAIAEQAIQKQLVPGYASCP